MPPDNNVALVTAIRAGELHRYSEVVERCDRAVRATLRRCTQDPVELEELVQETFYLGFRDLANLAEPARRRTAERRRQQAREAGRWGAPDASVSIDDTDETWIWEEVARLPEAFRTALELRYRHGLSYREVAHRLGVPLSTVRGRIHAARRALRERLRDQEERS